MKCIYLAYHIWLEYFLLLQPLLLKILQSILQIQYYIFQILAFSLSNGRMLPYARIDFSIGRRLTSSPGEGQAPPRGLRTCIHSRGCRRGEEFFRQTRRVFAGILCVFQENATQYGGKRPVHTAFEVVNTGSLFTAAGRFPR